MQATVLERMGVIYWTCMDTWYKELDVEKPVHINLLPCFLPLEPFYMDTNNCIFFLVFVDDGLWHAVPDASDMTLPDTSTTIPF